MQYIRENYDYKRCGNCAAYVPTSRGTRAKCMAHNYYPNLTPNRIYAKIGGHASVS